MTTAPRLSIVVVNWNTRDLLDGCLASIRVHAGAIPVEVFVVDNGSADGSQAMVRERHPDVQLLEMGRNLGFAAANNRALERCAGKYCLLLNSDTVLTAGALQTVLDVMDREGRVAVAGLQLLNADGSRQNSIASDPTLLTELFNKSLLRRLAPEKYPGKERSYAAPIDVETVIGACLFVRRSAMDEVGPLDEGYFFFLEETDWCLRFRRALWRVVHVPGASVYHLQGRSASRVNVRARIEYFRSRYRFFRKQRSAGAAGVLMFGLVLKTTVNLVFHSLLTLATLFRYRASRERARLYGAILLWHLRGCPASEGLSAS